MLSVVRLTPQAPHRRVADRQNLSRVADKHDADVVEVDAGLLQPRHHPPDHATLNHRELVEYEQTQPAAQSLAQPLQALTIVHQRVVTDLADANGKQPMNGGRTVRHVERRATGRSRQFDNVGPVDHVALQQLAQLVHGRPQRERLAGTGIAEQEGAQRLRRRLPRVRHVRRHRLAAARISLPGAHLPIVLVPRVSHGHELCLLFHIAFQQGGKHELTSGRDCRRCVCGPGGTQHCQFGNVSTHIIRIYDPVAEPGGLEVVAVRIGDSRRARLRTQLVRVHHVCVSISQHFVQLSLVKAIAYACCVRLPLGVVVRPAVRIRVARLRVAGLRVVRHRRLVVTVWRAEKVVIAPNPYWHVHARFHHRIELLYPMQATFRL